MTNIKILARVKPIFKNNSKSCLEVEENEISVNKIQKKCNGDHLVKYKYQFDQMFDDTSVNWDIYNSIYIDILKNMMKFKNNVTFYVYGETGSGKTHTLLGNSNEKGFLNLMLSDMLEINKNNIHVNVTEIYNNKCYDLINDNKHVYQRENGKNNFVLSSSTIIKIESKKDIIELHNKIINNRKVGISSENNASSRSHLLINIKFANKNLKILDLAGCEKAKNSICDSREKFKENGVINQSLFVLKECIRSLVSNKPYVPFRRSELTKMLKHSFDNSCKTFILATLSQDESNCGTSVDVLNYISDIKNIKSIGKYNLLPPINSNVNVNENVNEKVHVNVNENVNENVQGSPRFQLLYKNKHFLKNLQDKENKLLNEMIQKKSTDNLFDDYSKVQQKKLKLIRKFNGKLKPIEQNKHK